MALLGVNIDHVATLRQQRLEADPDPVAAALICEKAGADSIVAHLREDRRHIQDHDIISLKKRLRIRFNLEMSMASDVVALALKVKPAQATLVPENRRELTTEGGLDVIRQRARVQDVCRRLQDKGVEVSLFIAADRAQIDASFAAGARIIEIHTGRYAELDGKPGQRKELEQIAAMTGYAKSLGMTVNAGHGLKYYNTTAIATIPGMYELNIGHSIISRAVTTGLTAAVKEMRALARRR